ncbi:hypothetical protein BB560_000733 [Smittium megazygosporum]|uniref:glucan endo-1,3-beta-D-glucosidase n=1 Tax=Smittium megazygosporum TaxID=133381 RepID=A0A2T9ZJJ3_9FUNG|nr:hypothetical protein BB560_000733 [Smittium megazygosporum]
MQAENTSIPLECEPSVQLESYPSSDAAAMPFSTVQNNYAPNQLWGKIKAPYPTNKWWMNFVLENGDQPIYCVPYTVKSSIDGLQFFYPQPSPSNISVTMSTLSEWSIGSREGFTSRQVECFDDISMTYSWTTKSSASGASMSVPFVKGSPYMTIKYNQTTPKFSYPSARITSVLRDASKLSLKVVLENGRVWGMYSSEPIDLYVTQSGDIISDKPYNGYLRFTYFSDPNNYAQQFQVMKNYSRGIPIGVNVSFSRNTIIHNYVLANISNKSDVLMLGLPHHKQLLGNPSGVSGISKFTSLKGDLLPVAGNPWVLTYNNLNTIQFRYSKQIPDANKSEIQNALNSEFKPENPVSQDTSVYFRGKALSRMARFALIADELGSYAKRDVIIANLKSNIEYWLSSRISNPLRYDQTWGGICSQQSISDPGADFGNGRYNDHYFHYGYFIYAAAVIIKLAVDGGFWAQAWKPHLDAILGDYANIESNTTYFTRIRHMDLYDGHSWASGLFVFGLNRNQESTSEAVNAYYAAYLYALATNNAQSAETYNLLLTSEITSAQFYWQTAPGRGIYNDSFASNYIVGILWETSAQYTTWFGNNAEYIYGIQMLPFTPITFALLDKSWLTSAWPTIKARSINNNPSMEESWKGFMLMAGSIVDKNGNYPAIKALNNFDNGNSKTNTLWWSSVC